MRLLPVAIFVVILGGMLGIAHTWSEFSGIEERMELAPGVQVGDGGTVDHAPQGQHPVDSSDLPRAVVVGELSHDFGVLTRDEARSYNFVIRNDGGADLLVERQSVSCGLCVQTDFTTATVKPSEEILVPVTLRARKPGPALSENLELRTNDEAHELIRIDLIAYISEAAGASVSELALGTISTDEGGAAAFRVYGFVEEPLEILDCKVMERENPEYFEWKINDLTQEAVKAGQVHAKFGKEIKLTIKPGLPVGPLKQNIIILARAGRPVKIDVPISGRVTGDLSLAGGSKFTASKSLLSLGRIVASEGASAKLLLMVKGEHRDDVQVSVGECDPAEYLSVTVEERKTIQEGKTYLFPVTVEIPPNLPALNRLGGAGASFGKIVLQTTHPTAKAVTMHVRFAVE